MVPWSSHGAPPALHGVLVTCARPELLERTLAQLATQTRKLDTLVVVDNCPTPVTQRIGLGNKESARKIHYIAAPENLGPAGGLALGMRQLLSAASDGDYVVLLDDDDPPDEPCAFEELFGLAAKLSHSDSRVAGVGVVGARFDWRRGRLVRVPDAELVGPVPVDYLPSGHLPTYRVSCLTRVGVFEARLFFGLDDLEFGLRLRAAGYHLYAHGPRWRHQRIRHGHTDDTRVHRVNDSHTLPAWRRYYSIRNLIYILRQYGHRTTAVRVTLRSLLKPILAAVLSPERGGALLILTIRAIRDGWLDRMGRTEDPLKQARSCR